MHLTDDIPYTCFTDSMITLCWIRSSPSQWKPWVANRVSEIQKLTSPEWWIHCPGVQNPADLLTRGCSGTKLTECDLWWKGPPFLKDPDLISKLKTNESRPERYVLRKGKLPILVATLAIVQRIIICRTFQKKLVMAVFSIGVQTSKRHTVHSVGFPDL